MTTYSWFNVVFASICIIASKFFLRRREDWQRAIRTAAFVTVLAYPWDYFAGSLGAWTYENPGARLFSVPINDLVFIFFATILTTAVLANGRVVRRHTEADAKDR